MNLEIWRSNCTFMELKCNQYKPLDHWTEVLIVPLWN